MPIFSIKGRLGIFKGHSNISTNKYDILILPDTLFICSISSFKGENDRGSFHWRNGLLAEHREHSDLCQDFLEPKGLHLKYYNLPQKIKMLSYLRWPIYLILIRFLIAVKHPESHILMAEDGA